MSPSSLMVNGNLYLVITLVVLQSYYLSENVRRLSLYIQRMSSCQVWMDIFTQREGGMSLLSNVVRIV